jgi:hypothetical protein
MASKRVVQAELQQVDPKKVGLKNVCNGNLLPIPPIPFRVVVPRHLCGNPFPWQKRD